MALSLTRRVPEGDRGSPGGPGAQLARHRQRREGLCPEYAPIIVKGGELARGTRKRIEEYSRTHIKGDVHNTLLLEVVQEQGQQVDIEIKPLPVGIKDASFRTFRADNAEQLSDEDAEKLVRPRPAGQR